jgi:uncharacterized protein
MSDQDPTGSSMPPSGETATPAGAGEVTRDDRNLALLIHLLAIITGFLAPLIIWLIKKDSSKFIDHHGKQALNFQITILLAYIISWVLTFVFFVGCFIMPVVVIVDIVFCILAAVASSRGEWYRYPIALPLLK